MFVFSRVNTNTGAHLEMAFGVLPELVDVDVADRDDQNVAAVDHQKEYSNEKNVAKVHDDIPTAKDRSMGGW